MIGARGQNAAHNAVISYTESTQTDARLLPYDIWGSEAHLLMLGSKGILTDEDVRKILVPLERAREDAESGRFALDPQLEDVHMNVESYVIRAAGKEYGGRLHTARSRNDQVLTDARLYVRRAILDVQRRVVGLIEPFLHLAEGHLQTVLPGYTHTQHAQPITLAFWATAYATLLAEDLRRLAAAYRVVNRSPLGACALAGTNFPIDRHLTARLLGFDEVEEHALAVVSGRDFVLETVFALSMLMTNLSRISAEIIYATTHEFGTLTLDDAYALGSSIMPQKKNPDVAELARGRTGKVYGRLIEALTLLKGLPLGYHRDFQEDKPLLWESLDTVGDSAAILARVVATMNVHADRMLDLTYANFSTATELANELVRSHGLSFREAHEIVGSLVARLVKKGRTFRALDECAEFLATRGHPIAVDTLREILHPVEAVQRNRSFGGTSAESVAAMIERLRATLRRHTAMIEARIAGIDSARAETARAVAEVLHGRPVADVVSTRVS